MVLVEVVSVFSAEPKGLKGVDRMVRGTDTILRELHHHHHIQKHTYKKI
jgi:hypothetical protein